MRGWLGLLLKATLSVVVLAFIATRTDLTRIGSLMVSISGGSVVVALGVAMTQSLATAYRWVLVCWGVGMPVAPWPAVQALYASLFINQCLPSYVGGDAYRVYWLHREGNPLATAVRSVLIDRVSALMALVLMMVATLPRLFERFPNAAVQTGMLTIAASGVVGSVAFFAGDALPRRWRRWRIVAEVSTLSVSARRLLFNSANGSLAGGLAILVHVLSAVMMFIFAADLGIPLTIFDCLLLIPPVMLASALPISISSWGVREGVMVGALTMMGIEAEQALALSLLLGFSVLANALLGLLPLAFGGERFVASRAAEPPHAPDRAP